MQLLGCGTTTAGEPARLEAPTRFRVLAEVVTRERAFIPTGLHPTVLETGDPSGTGTDRSAPPSQKAPCRREPAARRASRGPRSGNPRRRLLVGSKGAE